MTKLPKNLQPRILVVSYAFPPINVQMTQVAVRCIAELSLNGFAVDVVSAAPDVWPLPVDDTWSDYVTKYTKSITRIGDQYQYKPLTNWYRMTHPFIDVPDAMIQVNEAAYHEILGRDVYDAIVSISPFHSVNKLMMLIKDAWPNVPWIAYFGDPWAENPLETRFLIKCWNRYYEKRALRLADAIVQSSSQAIIELQSRNPNIDPKKLHHIPHTFDSTLYPNRSRESHARFTFRFLGTLFADRSPLPFLNALRLAIEKCPDVADQVAIELIGTAKNWHQDWVSGSLSSIVSVKPPVSYFESLELMYDADALLLIEADTQNLPFMPSKLVDYLGANTPILGVLSKGQPRSILQQLGAKTFEHNDVNGIAEAIISMVLTPTSDRNIWCDQKVRLTFDLHNRNDGIGQIVKKTIAND